MVRRRMGPGHARFPATTGIRHIDHAPSWLKRIMHANSAWHYHEDSKGSPDAIYTRDGARRGLPKAFVDRIKEKLEGGADLDEEYDLRLPPRVEPKPFASGKRLPKSTG